MLSSWTYDTWYKCWKEISGRCWNEILSWSEMYVLKWDDMLKIYVEVIYQTKQHIAPGGNLPVSRNLLHQGTGLRGICFLSRPSQARRVPQCACCTHAIWTPLARLLPRTRICGWPNLLKYQRMIICWLVVWTREGVEVSENDMLISCLNMGGCWSIRESWYVD